MVLHGHGAAAGRARASGRGLPRLPTVQEGPIKLFDNLTYIGFNDVGAWVVPTSAGLILFDTLNSTDDAMNVIEPEMQKAGFDPAQIKYILVGHGHADHFGGASYLQMKYHAKVLAAMPDWAAIQRGGRGGAAPGLTPDMDVRTARSCTLGDTTVTMIRLPGHTPGTIGMVVPAKYQGPDAQRGDHERHADADQASLDAFKHVFNDELKKLNVETFLGSHPDILMNSLMAMESIRDKYPTGAHPLLLSKDHANRYMDIVLECARRAWRAGQADARQTEKGVGGHFKRTSHASDSDRSGALLLLTPFLRSRRNRFDYVSKLDYFSINMPRQPKIEETSVPTSTGSRRCRRVSTRPTRDAIATRSRSSTTATRRRFMPRATSQCIHEAGADKPGLTPQAAPRSRLATRARTKPSKDIRGAMMWATWNIVETAAKVTHLAHYNVDVIEGHEVHTDQPGRVAHLRRDSHVREPPVHRRGDRAEGRARVQLVPDFAAHARRAATAGPLSDYSGLMMYSNGYPKPPLANQNQGAQGQAAQGQEGRLCVDSWAVRPSACWRWRCRRGRTIRTTPTK